MKKIFSIYKIHREIINYLFFGGATTFVSWSVYGLMILITTQSTMTITVKQSINISNIISWAAAVTFAFFANKLWVFESRSWNLNLLLREAGSFLGTRILSGLIEISGVPFLFYIGLDYPLLGIEGFAAKAVISVFVVLLNYIFGKFIVFTRGKQKALKNKSNKSIISLIGMTGAGKTTVGQILAERLNYKFFDLDLIITEKNQKTPSEIFSLYGEEFFRKTEAEELENIFNNNNNNSENFILSCGGGIVLNEKNRKILKEKSFVIWLRRPISEIIKNEEILKRPPINNDINNYTAIFKRREKLYEETCDIKSECDGIFETVDNLIKIIK